MMMMFQKFWERGVGGNLSAGGSFPSEIDPGVISWHDVATPRPARLPKKVVFNNSRPLQLNYQCFYH